MKATKRFIPEITILRGISTLAVIIMHSIDRHNYSQLLAQIEKLMLFATPTFLFISAFLMFYCYKETSIKKYLSKKFKYLCVPYIIWSIVYSFLYNSSLPSPSIIITNILTGSFHIYFILIIMQFYFLFIIFQRLNLERILINYKGLIIAFLINFYYLSLFSYYPAPSHLVSSWWHKYYLFFPAWIFYFILGGFLAKNYSFLKNQLSKRKKQVWLLTILAVLYILSTLEAPITSKRPEVLFYTPAIIAFLFLITGHFKKENTLITLVSRYSFGIYLSHRLFYTLTYNYFLETSPSTFFVLCFMVQLVGGLALTLIISHLPGSQFIIGKIKEEKQANQTSPRFISNYKEDLIQR